MTIFIEISRPFVRPFAYKSRTIYRFGFGWFGIGILRVPFREFTETSFDWRLAGWGNQ
jgi:hypothetical protein